MIKIGLVNLDISHPKYFSEYLNRGSRARYAAVFNDGFRGDDEVEGFMKQTGVEKRCSTIKELADCVDIGFIQSCNWDKHIEQANYFIKAGKPVFIDKPTVGNLADCKRLEELANNGAIILGSSSVRYAKEIEDFLKRPESERGRIVSIFGTSGVDEFNYTIHIVEALHQLAGGRAAVAQFVGRAKIEDKICETFFVVFENGITAAYNSFTGLWQPFEVVIMTTKGTYQFRIALEDIYKLYAQLLDKICDYMETGKSTLAPVDTLTEAVKIMLAARISRENGGRQVKPADIPDNDPGYDGYAFEKEYAANAKKIYV
jgi:predicted dehydrogenase